MLLKIYIAVFATVSALPSLPHDNLGLEAAGDINIVGGIEVKSINTYPFIGSASIGGSKHSCGGAMIAHNLFLVRLLCLLHRLPPIAPRDPLDLAKSRHGDTIWVKVRIARALSSLIQLK
jgi:hypothetical protein